MPLCVIPKTDRFCRVEAHFYSDKHLTVVRFMIIRMLILRGLIGQITGIQLLMTTMQYEKLY